MIQSTYKPINVAEFEASKLNFLGTGVSGLAAPGTATNIDYLVTDDALLTGVQLNCKNQLFGDSVSFQVLDLSGTAKIRAVDGTFFSVPAGTVLNTFVSNWRLSSDWQRQVDENLPYPAKVYGGMTLRLIYLSIASGLNLSSVNVGVNYDLHQCLV